MATKKLKLDEEAISEILVADTDSESGAEVSDVEEEEDEQQQLLVQQASAKTNHRLQQVAEDYRPGDRLKEGTQMFILSLVQQKV